MVRPCIYKAGGVFLAEFYCQGFYVAVVENSVQQFAELVPESSHPDLADALKPWVPSDKVNNEIASLSFLE